MRFQTSKIIKAEDPEVILRVLTICFQEISLDVIRNESGLTVHGLGPSLSVINRHDTAILHVETRDGQTVIGADVSYLAANVPVEIPQDVIVGLKLESVFAQMANLLTSERIRKKLELSSRISPPTQIASIEPIALPHTSEDAHEALIASLNPPEPIPEHVTMLKPPNDMPYEAPAQTESSPPNKFSFEEELAALIASFNLPEHIGEHVTGGVPHETLKQSEASLTIQFPLEATHAAPIASLSSSEPIPEHVTIPEQSGNVPHEAPKQSKSSPPLQSSSYTPVSWTHQTPQIPRIHRIKRTAAVSVVTLFLLALVFYLVRHNQQGATPLPVSVLTDAPSRAPQPIESVGAPHTAVAGSQTYLTVVDPNEWLKYWGNAMRTRDPAAQASFYADPVDQYLGREHISNAEVYRNKKTAIEDRRGLWTVKLEKIVIAPPRDGVISVRLVKHFMSQTEPAQISEQLVQSRLQLKRIGGQWKIISEEDLTARNISS